MSNEITPQDNTEGTQDPQVELTEKLYGSEDKKVEEESELEADSKEELENPDGKSDLEKDKDESESNSEEDKEIDYSDLELPKDSKLKDADKESIVSYAKEQGLSKEAAKNLLEKFSKSRDSYFNDLQADFKEKVQSWESLSKEDKEIGGEKYKSNLDKAEIALERFGTDDFKKMLKESGFGSHPEVVRIFSRIGKAMDDSDFVRGQKSVTPKTYEELFYGKQDN